jgi:acetate---CoA ligase (ADP-forming)
MGLVEHHSRALDPDSLRPLFRPRSVAIIGASDNPNKVGGRPLHFLKKAGFSGALYPVNPRGGIVQDLDAYRSLAEIDGSIDQAIIAVAAPQVLQAVRDCIARGIPTLQIFAAGFAEQGERGSRAQAEIEAIARKTGTRVVGPNSLGLFEVHEGFFGTFSTALDGAWPDAGDIGIATQSGAFGSYVYGLAQAHGLRFSAFVATGNEVDVDVADCVAYLAQDPRTRTILVTIEGTREGARLTEALQRARSANKPVIVMKVGASEAGAAAAASHTGSLAGADAVYDAMLRQVGAFRASSIEEMIDIAYVCSAPRLPRGNRLGIATTSGGIGVLLADAAAAHRMVLPDISDAAGSRITALVPFASPHNPLDTSAAILGDFTLFTRMLEIMIEDCELDSIICFLAHVGRNAAHMAQLEPELVALRQRYPGLPIVLCMVCDGGTRSRLERAGFLVFEEPARTVRALAAAGRLAAPVWRREAAASSLLPLVRHFPARLTERDAKALLAEIGIAVVAEQVASTAEEARAAARQLGLPVAMKVLSAEIAHKSDIGGVALGLKSEDDVETAFQSILQRVREAQPDATVDGVLVSPMVSGVAETILGVRRDPVFGPIVMFGLGGVFVEIFKDVTFRPAPFGLDEARAMIAEIRGFPLLTGARGRAKADLAALADALVRLSRFAAANRETIAEIDINPYLICSSGGFAVDALIVPVGKSGKSG